MLKYLPSVLLAMVFMTLCFGLTAASRGSFGALWSNDTTAMRSHIQDTTTAERESTPRRGGGMHFSDIVEGKAVDSVVFDARNKLIHSYKSGDVTYQGMNLKADYMRVDMETKNVFAHGYPDTTNLREDGTPRNTQAEFSDGGSPYSMDTITYNLETRKAKIKGIATQQGDGWLIGSSVKMHPDETIHIGHGMYTTCDCIDHPHFYIHMTFACVMLI